MQPVTVFSAAWFAQWQRVLIGLLACPLVGRWFRWVLCIRRHDVGSRGRIVQLLPHAYIVANPNGSFTMDCRTHAKYAKRLSHAFYPIWRVMHAWDMRIANPLVPAWNLGFDTLTVYPDPNPETTTVDGYVGRSGVDEAWGTIRAGAGNGANHTGDGLRVEIQASATANQWDTLRRSLTLFDTSALTSGATVSDAVLSLWGSEIFDSFSGTSTVDIYTSTPAANTSLAGSDYGQTGTTSQTGSALALSGLSTTAYNAFTFDATGRGNIAKTGVSKFALKNANFDVANVAPTWSSGTLVVRANFRDADTVGTANDSKLVVTYELTYRNRVAFHAHALFAPNYTNAASTSASLGSAVVAGQLLTFLGHLGSSVATVSTVTDSLSNVWTLARRQRGSAANSSYASELWFAPNSAAGTPTVTVTLTSTAAGRMQFGIHSWTNASTISTACLAQVASTLATSSLVGTGGGLPNVSSGSVVIVGWMLALGNALRTNPTGFSTLAPQNSTRENSFYQLQTAAQSSVNPIWQITQSTAFTGVIAEFYGSTFTPVAGTFRPNTLPTLGVQ